jgi:hypothetical protein
MRVQPGSFDERLCFGIAECQSILHIGSHYSALFHEDLSIDDYGVDIAA